ncbi:elongation factor P--(R)-beta-lysine ligase [Buchnera aphidicola]|uniref:Elongation factor P--(R)-beta-lysine ligase n=1 Tax=Buchnera aphidicola (Sarucallis kahawaluokalani) TaxID=1241878 RepID=A0A4D6YJN1_9GAMM|nr:elongation factor P--(R)-beta-lysine ligase [Buchnera aphidicola]QCI26174.1 elongation factor P--(R)-beta-lysine ligase [Buchnera aphidicola (Sarucallis kahawaluokalani)]
MFRKYNVMFYQRSKIMKNIRDFFVKKGIVEIETPILTKCTVTDNHLIPLEVPYHLNDSLQSNMWLITSPELHMKRILSRGMGSIYQICHAFRDKEIGDLHNIEFTILEWYQLFYNMFDMMEVVEVFLQKVFLIKRCDKISYRDVFRKILDIDPICTNIEILYNILKKINYMYVIHKKDTISDLLNLIFLIAIQPKIGLQRPIFVYHYPVDQAMLARVNKHDHNIADRFEIFFQGIELGNGFYELIDEKEQYRRFLMDDIQIKKTSKRIIDMRFLRALKSRYMPTCSGVAFGLDRIIMIMCNVRNIRQVMSFTFKDC